MPTHRPPRPTHTTHSHSPHHAASPAPVSPSPAKVDNTWTLDQFQVPPEEGKARFHDFSLATPILHAIADLEFRYCTPIQAQSLPHTLKGSDLLGKAQTGTGKTAAFLLTAFEHILRNPTPRHGAHRAKGSPRVLILAPTRELVVQIIRDAESLSQYLPIRSLAVFGGTDFKKQKDMLRDQVIDIVAATPGRLLDFQGSHDINLRHVEILVLDEADRMLDMGFIPDVRRIIRCLPAREQRQTLFFSATLGDTVKRLAEQWTRSPIEVEIEPENVAVDTVVQTTLLLRADEKLTALYNIFTREKPTRTLVFCNRRDTAERINDLLKAYDIHCALLSGSVNQKARMRTLDDFRAGQVPIIVATDVAGRGIHVDGIDLVINYDVPHEPESYVHRIGRTGRAGASGRSYTFACEEEAFSLPEIEQYLGRPLIYIHPDETLLAPLPPPKHPLPRREPSRHQFGGNRGRGGPPHRGGPRRQGPPRQGRTPFRPR